MKIGYLGGVKNGLSANFLMGYDKTSLEWEIKRERPTQNFFQSGGTITYTINQDYDLYNLRIITREKEQKFFYVFESLQLAEIESLSSDYWDKSETIGYVF
ncbi:hypothetical protein IL972_00325 [Acinetobacter sp. FL51]|uniref:hypothetical protein n=1 Tax=Acinetobacter sp. FL51 TaxID=2777978 RepID=UPI0018E1603E|nr:hypothetical protein [Acinetobacter sp. FL51]MBI1450383.1 hypothetical protein [Acinetobacter sp. FL51]